MIPRPTRTTLFPYTTLFRSVGIGLHDLLIHRGGRIGSFALEALAHVEQRVGGVLVTGEDPQELPETEPGGGDAPAPVLLQGEIVHLVGAGARRVTRWADGGAGARRQRGLGLAGELLQPGALLA